MAEKLDPRQVVTFGRLVVVLLALAVVGVGCHGFGLVHEYRRMTYLDVRIHDVTKAHMAGHLSVRTSAITPFLFTETRACNLIGDAIAPS